MDEGQGATDREALRALPGLAPRPPRPPTRRAGRLEVPPTDRQLEVLRVLVPRRGPQRTYREAADVLGIASTNAIADTVEALERRGLLQRPRSKSARSLRITRAGREALRAAQEAA